MTLYWGGSWLAVYKFKRCPCVHLVAMSNNFGLPIQRSWRRRLWDRPHTSSSSPSSWRNLRLDTIRARITKFRKEVELDERCPHTKFYVTGYFYSPASRHFVNYFSKFSVQYLRNGSTKMHQTWTIDCTQRSIHPFKNWSLLLTPFACITQNRFQIHRPISRNVLNAPYPHFACWFLPSLAITDQGGKWRYLMDRLHR